MDKNSYPNLSESEIHSRLSSLFPGRITTEPSLRNPDYIKQAYALIIEMLCMVDINHQNSLPTSLINRHCRFPEMHGTSPIRFLVLLKRCLQNACIEQVFTINDLKNPTVKRSQRFLSGLINFCLHVTSTRHTEDQLFQGRLKFQKDLLALEEHRDSLKNELSELDCQRMSDELEVGQMKRQADEKLAAARALVGEMEKLRPTLDKLIFERDEEAALREEAEHGRKHVEARLALLREEIVDTPVDQLKSEIEDNEEQIQRQEEIVLLKQNRFTELQRQISNFETSYEMLKETHERLSRIDGVDKDVQKLVKEHQAMKACREKEEASRTLRSSSSSRKKLSELNDTLIKLKLIDKENEKHHELFRHKKESELAVVTADVTTLEAEVLTKKEHLVDLKERLRLEEEKNEKRLAKLDEAIAVALDYIEDFRERAIDTLSRLE